MNLQPAIYHRLSRRLGMDSSRSRSIHRPLGLRKKQNKKSKRKKFIGGVRTRTRAPLLPFLLLFLLLLLISSEAPSLDSSSTSEHNPPVGFFTARAAESLQTGLGIPLKAPAFNPHLESPSIRKTAGIDHTKTKPVGREAVGAPPQPPVARANFINPQSDKTRRDGRSSLL